MSSYVQVSGPPAASLYDRYQAVRALIAIHADYRGLNLEYLTYLTDWSLVLLGLAGLLGFFNTERYYRHERAAKTRAEKLRQEFIAGKQEQLNKARNQCAKIVSDAR